MKPRRNLFVVVVLIISQQAIGQALPPAPEGISCNCWIVSDNTDELYRYNSASNTQTLVGPTGVAGIEAMTYGPQGATIYAADGGNFGTIDLNTGTFTLIGAVGSGTGDLGTISFSDIDGLGYSPEEQVIYGTVRRGSNDLLIKIDPATGQAIAGAFGGKDYVAITGVPSKDIDDITIDHTTGVAYVISDESKLYTINLQTGAAELVGNVGRAHIEGMGIDAEGNLFGSVESPNEIIYIDKSTGQGYLVGTRPSGGDAEGIVCYIPVTVSGTVFNDYDGLSNNVVDKDGIAPETGLYAVLYDNTTGKVADVTAVAEDGTFRMQGSLGNDFNVYITTTPAAIGQEEEPVVTVPDSYGFTGENNCGTAAGCSGSDGAPDGILDLGSVTNNITQANFGLSRPPVAEDDSSLDNPEGTTVTIDILANDSSPDGSLVPATIKLLPPADKNDVTVEDTDGNGYTDRLVVPDEGVWQLDEDDQLSFIPEEGFTGDPTPIRYTVENEAGMTSHEADAVVTYTSPLPVRLVNFSALQKDGSILLSWEAATEESFSHYEIERSTDGSSFNSIAAIQGKGNNTRYTYTDNTAADGNNYYRLRMVDMNGAVAYSEIRIAAIREKAILSLYPNPAIHTVTVSGLKGGEQLRVVNSLGQEVLTLRASTAIHQIHIGNWAPGVYYIMVTEGSHISGNYRLIKK